MELGKFVFVLYFHYNSYFIILFSFYFSDKKTSNVYFFC